MILIESLWSAHKKRWVKNNPVWFKSLYVSVWSKYRVSVWYKWSIQTFAQILYVHQNHAVTSHKEGPAWQNRRYTFMILVWWKMCVVCFDLKKENPWLVCLPFLFDSRLRVLSAWNLFSSCQQRFPLGTAVSSKDMDIRCIEDDKLLAVSVWKCVFVSLWLTDGLSKVFVCLSPYDHSNSPQYSRQPTR